MAGKVTKIIEKSNSSPLILLFQNGEITAQKRGEKRKIGLETDKGGLRKVTVKLDSHEYEGNEEHSLTGRRTFIGIRKAATGEVKLIEVSKTFPLLNKIHNVEVAKQEMGGNFQARNSALVKQFGGKKGIRRIDKNEKYRVNTAINETSLLSSVKEISVKEDEESVTKQMTDNIANFLPPCNREATHPDWVYNVNELIGQDVIDELPDFSLEKLSSTELLDFTQSVIKSLPSKPSREAVIGVAMIEAILRFVSMNVIQLRKSGIFFSEHEVIHHKIIELFTTKNDRGVLTRSLYNRDKATAYAIAIAAATTKQVSLSLLAKDTCYGRAKALQLVRAVGCTIRERASDVYVLKLPLPPFKLSAGRQRK